MLYWRKSINFFSVRQYDDTTWVLSCRSADSCTSDSNTIDFTGTLLDSTFFIIFLYIAIGGFIRKRTNRACFKGMTLSKNDLCIFMRLCLIIARKIQVKSGSSAGGISASRYKIYSDLFEELSHTRY